MSIVVFTGVLPVAATGAPRTPPPGWVADGDSIGRCDRIAGTYEVRGERDSGSARFTYPRQLTGMVLGYLGRVTHLSITFTDSDSVRFVAWAGDTVRAERILPLSRQGADCAAGGLYLPEKGYSSDVLIGSARSQVHLWPGRDGELVVGSRSREIGLLFLVIPWKTDRTEWYRFPRKATPTE